MEATQLHHSGVDVLSKLMSANFVGEVRNTGSGEPSQRLTHGQRRALGRRPGRRLRSAMSSKFGAAKFSCNRWSSVVLGMGTIHSC
jgi:hypothetical protein